MSEVLKHKILCSNRRLCRGLALPYRTILRWRHRQEQGLPLLQRAGPRKVNPLPLGELQARVAALVHQAHRTLGAPALARELSKRASTRQVAGCVEAHRRELRRQQRQSWKQIEWTTPNLAWSLDGSETPADRSGVKLRFVAFQDLAARYRFEPLFALELAGAQIAEHLDRLFNRHGAPLFLKRDNGSNLNCETVNEVLAHHGVIPLNSPVYLPRYNGAIERSIGLYKQHLLPCLGTPDLWDLSAIGSLGRALVVQLNAQRRRCLAGQSPAAVFHAGLRTWGKRFRAETFQWIETRWRATIAQMEQPTHRRLATAWRTEAVAWLRCQQLIRCSTTATVLPHSHQNFCT